MEIKYIDNDKNKGIKYDWDKIKKAYRKLGCPKHVYNPCKPDFDIIGYNICMSDRSEGKTTNPLLLGMVMNDMYGTILHYLRYDTQTITPKLMGQLFDTIYEFDYIPKLTHGLWNSAFYYGKKWYYCNRDDSGSIVEKAPSHFMYCIGLNESDRLKSSYNCPVGDFILFDEFVQLSGYGYNDFIAFTDICKTIIRDRLSPVVFMMSNTIDITTPWFDELCIRDDVNTMQMGDIRQIVTSEGTHIFCEILPENKSEQRANVNKRFFGFKNPKLASVTGKGTWAFDTYPHIEDIDHTDTHILHDRVFVRQSGKLLKMQLAKNKMGICVYVVPATRLHDDSFILTHDDITDPREIYGFGKKGSLLDIYWKLYKANKFYYATNMEGALFKGYINQTKEKNKTRLII